MNSIEGMIEDLEREETRIGGCTTVGELIIALERLQMLEEQQPKRGKWIKAIGEENLALWMCDQCGCKIYSETEHDRKKFHAWCGECGARMDADIREVQNNDRI